MSKKVIWTIVILAVGFPGVNCAEETKTELVLIKQLVNKFTPVTKRHTFETIFTVEKGWNYTGFLETTNVFCPEEYSLILDDPPRTTTTVYGQPFFKGDCGYVTLKKSDYRRVWVWDPEYFSDGKWAIAKANKDIGTY